MVAVLEHVSPLRRDDLAAGVENGEERVAHAVLQLVVAQAFLACLEQRYGVGRFEVDRHQLIFVGEDLGHLPVCLEHVVQPVAPAAPVAAEHEQDTFVGLLRPRRGLGDLNGSVGRLVVDRSTLGRDRTRLIALCLGRLLSNCDDRAHRKDAGGPQPLPRTDGHCSTHGRLLTSRFQS